MSFAVGCALHVARAGGVNAYAPAVEEPISDPARFERLLDGIAAELAASDAAALDADFAETERAARAESRLIARLRAQRSVCLDIVGAAQVTGLVAAVGRDVVVLAADDGDWAIPVWGICGVIDPDGGSREAASVSERLGFASVARAWARQRSVVRVLLIGAGPVHGTIDSVGADHLDLAEHDPGEARRPEAVRRRRALPLGAIAAIRRR